jgi:hypothetical protein
MLRAFLVAVSLPSLALAQTANVSWHDVWDGPASQDDFLVKVATDAQGNVYVAGRSYNASVGFPPLPPTQDALVSKYSPTGVLLWAQRIDRNGGDDVAQDVIVEPVSGDVIATGYFSGNFGGNFVTDLWLARFDPTGNVLWSLYRDGSGASADFGRALLLDDLGEIYVGASSYGATTGSDMAVFKFDGGGGFLWETHVDGTAHAADSGGLLAWHPSGDLLVFGQLSSTAGAGDLGLARMTRTGVIAWQDQRDSPSHGADFALSAACDAAGDIYVAGWSTIGADTAPTLAKWSAAGAPQWSFDLPETAAGAGQFRKVAVDAAGRIDVVGHTAVAGHGLDLITAQYDASGAQRWAALHDGAAHGDETAARAISVDAAGNVVVCGASNGPGGIADADSVVLRYDASGALRWIHTGVEPASEDRAQDLVAGPGSRLVYGAWVRPGTRYDVLVVALDEQGVPYCLGDGSAGPCPCGNESAPGLGEGCRSSLGRGATIVDTGIASLSADTLVLEGSGMTSSLALYMQGDLAVPTPAPFAGDGLLCVGGVILRLGSKTNVAGASRFPEAGNPSISVRGQVTVPGTRAYQVWYRNAAAFCTGATFNLSSGRIVTWTL